MTLTELYSALSFTTPIGCGILAGKAAGADGVLSGLAVGAGLGVIGFLGTRAVIKRGALDRKLDSGITSLSRFWSSCLFFCLYIGIALNGFLAILVTKLLVHYVAA
jgi:hypothetical protein